MNPTVRSWPEPLSAEALHGLAGEFVRTIEPHTESDPAALLIQFLVGFGSVIGRGPHWQAEADRHGLNLFTVLVGDTSKGRKGTSWAHVRTLVSEADTGWKDNCIQTGLSSGEGLIHVVRDPDLEKDDLGAIDTRLLVVESEFASTLRMISRDGNTLSPVIRQAWDGTPLQVITKQFPEKASFAHISIIGHITRGELAFELNRVDAASGFGNRFLWGCVKRSKALPDGGQIPEDDFNRIAAQFKDAVDYARSLGDHQLRRNDEARELWHSVYAELSEGKEGLFGAVTSRAEAQVMRIACIYALLDKSAGVGREHLLAALAVWKYCEGSARYIFGDALGDPLADTLVQRLRGAGPGGMTRTQISAAVGRNRDAADISRALDLLAKHGMAKMNYDPTEGRSAERWFAT